VPDTPFVSNRGCIMTLGLSIENFTRLHTVLSLIGIVAGLIALGGMLGARRPGFITHLFLATTVLTTVTGFLFPISVFTPALGTGIASTLLLIPALAGLYMFHLAGAWRWIYVVTAVMALWINCFVLVVQAFQKVPALFELAPTQSEPPFLIAQGVVLVAFLVGGFLAVKRFHPGMAVA
jgi:hypothetical protein